MNSRSISNLKLYEEEKQRYKEEHELQGERLATQDEALRVARREKHELLRRVKELEEQLARQEAATEAAQA